MPEQSKERAEYLMEQQRLGDYEEGLVEDDDEEFCAYCGEPLEDGLCSASCNESAADEGRDEDNTCFICHSELDENDYCPDCDKEREEESK